MALRRLCKAANSGDDNLCPAVYVTDDPARMVAQGVVLDTPALAEMQQVAADEGGVALRTETVLRAAGLFLAEHGHPIVRAEVEAFLAGWDCAE